MDNRMRIKYIDEVKYCCKKMKKYYESHNDIKLNDGIGIIVNGKEIYKCPFCYADIEVDVSVVHWGGE